ncbi:MAG: CehA/McbA family metallohydrolase, partial [Candidatus Poribacteria bacterium]|nr:CehA/McbA family metallohydrolase [Candidatus Poribacteria bacterium]
LTQPLDGWELWNTNSDANFRRAREEWIARLLAGIRKPVIAGSDAHGDFNRGRSTIAPFFTVGDCFDEAFGRPRTAVYTPDDSQETLCESMRGGNIVMTNGPLAVMRTEDSEGNVAVMGERLRADAVTVRVNAVSTEEFGELSRIVLYVGEVGGGESERVLAEDAGFLKETTAKLRVSRSSYIRLEAEATRDGETTYALTNPIWIDSHP